MMNSDKKLMILGPSKIHWGPKGYPNHTFSVKVQPWTRFGSSLAPLGLCLAALGQFLGAPWQLMASHGGVVSGLIFA